MVGFIVEVTKGCEEGTHLELGLMDVLLLECHLSKPFLGLMLPGGVFALALEPIRVVDGLIGLLVTLHIRVVGDEVDRVSIVKELYFPLPHHRFMQLLWNHVNYLSTSDISSSLRHSTCSYEIGSKEDKADKAGEC